MQRRIGKQKYGKEFYKLCSLNLGSWNLNLFVSIIISAHFEVTGGLWMLASESRI